MLSQPRRSVHVVGDVTGALRDALYSCLSKLPGPDAMRLRSLIPAGAILALSVLSTILLADQVRRDGQSTARQSFEAAVREKREAIQDALRTYAQVLRGGVGLYTASPSVSAEDWRAYFGALAIDQEFPGMQGFGYARVLSPQGDGLRTSIVYLEPDNWRNRRALGFDMAAEAIRRRAMERARDLGEPSLSGRVTLVQETGVDRQAGSLLYLPVYGRAASLPTMAERRTGLTGFVYGAFRMDDLLTKLFARQSPAALDRLHLRLYDGAEAVPEQMFYDSASAHGSDDGFTPAHHTSTQLDMLGATWTLEVASRPAFEAAGARHLHWTVLSLGLVLSLLISMIAAQIALARDRSQQSARLLSTEIAERKRAEERVLVANQELVHRVKNTLTIVSAIATQTARHSTSTDEFNRAFAQRLGALGRVHDLLRPGAAAATDLDALMKNVLEPYAAGRTDALRITGPAVGVPQNDTLMFSLLINELATNATKYGAWSVPAGRVEVGWRLEPGEQRDTLVIDWREHGGPPVTAPQRTGFGSNVMRFAIERSMGGSLTLDYAPGGVSHVLRLPWGPAREADDTANAAGTPA